MFQFTWVFPRFCVVGEGEWKAFIPYGGYLGDAPSGACEWVRGEVVEIGEREVRLGVGEVVGFEFLVLAMGASGDVPSRLGVEGREEGIEELRSVQGGIRGARNLVVVGGGPAGVELAADAKGMYPDKNVTLIHSRPRLLNHFGPGLHDAAMKTMKELGVEVVLEERLVSETEENGVITLQSGKEIPCDLLVSHLNRTRMKICSLRSDQMYWSIPKLFCYCEAVLDLNLFVWKRQNKTNTATLR